MDRAIYIRPCWSAADIAMLKAEFELLNQRAVVRFACDCAERACKRATADQRAYAAILAGRSWADGLGSVSAARKAAFDAHAAARQTNLPSAQFAIRSAGHAAATAHVITHAAAAADYAARSAEDALEERAWQYAHLVHLLQALRENRAET